jgi:magnesium transporter
MSIALQEHGILFGMVERKIIDGIEWIDCESPTAVELDSLVREFDIDPFVREELSLPTLHPFVIPFSHYLYLILHFPVSEHSHARRGHQEIDCIVGKDFLITVRYDAVDELHHFHKVLETEAILDREPEFRHAGELFVRIMTRLYGGVVDELMYLGSKLESIEERLFDGDEKRILKEVSLVARTLLSFRQALRTHEEPLESFIEHGTTFFGKHFTVLAQGLLGEGYRIRRLVESHVETVRELRETNSGLLYSKQNEVIKVLTIMTFVCFPLSLIATIFGMSTKHTPIIGFENDFWIIVGLMGVATLIFFLFFRWQKWL